MWFDHLGVEGLWRGTQAVMIIHRHYTFLTFNSLVYWILPFQDPNLSIQIKAKRYVALSKEGSWQVSQASGMNFPILPLSW